MKPIINIANYGFSNQFRILSQEFEHFSAARILSQEKRFYRVISDKGEKLAEVSGRFRYNSSSSADFPAVGDFVMIDWNEVGDNAIIHHVLPRKSCFVRKAAGDIQQEQVVASNIDTIFLCISLNNDYNLRRLERYISIAWESGATPVVVLTKSDLCDTLDEKILEVSSVAIGVDIVVTSSVEQSGYQKLVPFLSKGKTVAFIGSSGVGKSTLINCLLGEEHLSTNGLRNDDRGRHTTTHRELILLPSGGMVIDTPGMRELGIWDSQIGIDKTFSDIDKIAEKCRFRDCTHSKEPGCAIQEAIENGQLKMERWQSYQKLKAETSYADDKEGYRIIKERREKEISKLIKKLPIKK